MKAVLFVKPESPLIIEEISMPEPNTGEILIKVVACGVCHTDLHYIEHGVPTFKKPPVILGHEASGVVQTDGNIFKKGDRVLIPSVLTCGECDFCKAGRENLCKNMIMPGNSIDGAFAQFIKVPEKDILRMPDEIPLEEGCIIADAISTPYHAVVNRAKIKSSDRVFVIGCGGVGINVVQIASILGAEVIACDKNLYKRQKALDFGAKYAFNPDEIPVKDFLKQNGGFVDVAFEVIGKPETIETAYKTLGIGGKLCIIGYTNKNISINPAKIMFYEQEIFGSLGCKPSDYLEIFDLIKQNKINLSKLISHKYSLEKINTALDEIRNSSAIRNIILPNGGGQDPLFP